MDKIKLLRKNCKMTQKDLSEITGIPVRTIQNWENGISKPKPYAAKILLDAIERYREEHAARVYKDESGMEIEKLSIKAPVKTTRKRKKFIKPSINEIEEYAISRNSVVDPEEFFEYYNSKGWKIGRSLMDDWRATFRSWEIRRKNEAKRSIHYKKPLKKEIAAYMLEINNDCAIIGKTNIVDEVRAFYNFNEQRGWSCLPDWKFAVERWFRMIISKDAEIARSKGQGMREFYDSQYIPTEYFDIEKQKQLDEEHYRDMLDLFIFQEEHGGLSPKEFEEKQEIEAEWQEREAWARSEYGVGIEEYDRAAEELFRMIEAGEIDRPDITTSEGTKKIHELIKNLLTK